jgi:hypothetical protein
MNFKNQPIRSWLERYSTLGPLWHSVSARFLAPMLAFIRQRRKRQYKRLRHWRKFQWYHHTWLPPVIFHPFGPGEGSEKVLLSIQSNTTGNMCTVPWWLARYLNNNNLLSLLVCVADPDRLFRFLSFLLKRNNLVQGCRYHYFECVYVKMHPCQ